MGYQVPEPPFDKFGDDMRKTVEKHAKKATAIMTDFVKQERSAAYESGYDAGLIRGILITSFIAAVLLVAAVVVALAGSC